MAIEVRIPTILRSYTGGAKIVEGSGESLTALIDECRLRMAIYSEFAPKLMGEDEVRKVVSEVLAELSLDAPTARDKGKIMKTLMPRVKGKADGALVNRVLAGFLG